VAVGYSFSNAGPRVNGKRGFRFAHKEIVTGLVNTSTSFQILPICLNTPGLDFNPALSSMFPWLSTIATNFERYRFHSLKCTLIPSVSTATPGRVYMAADYDYDDNPNVNKQQLMSYANAVEGPVYQKLTFTASVKELHRDMPWKYCTTITRNNFVEARTAFGGFLLVGIDSTTYCNYDMVVDYDVEFELPQLEMGAIFDASTGTVPTSTTLSTTSGTTFLAPSAPLAGATIVPSPVQIVPTNTPYVPSLAATLGGVAGVLLPYALDIKNATDCVVSLENKLASNTVTPNQLILNDTRQDVGVFDSLGTFLGWVRDAAGSIITKAGGPENSGAGAGIAGNFIKLATAISIPQLISAYRTARFLAPIVQSTLSMGATGSSGFGLKVQKV